MTDVKLKEMILDHNLGYHHAGLSPQDKRVVEQMFSAGLLPVLTCTSTLALGVNLPAQLVIIKSTLQMVAGGQWREYSESQVQKLLMVENICLCYFKSSLDSSNGWASRQAPVLQDSHSCHHDRVQQEEAL